MSDKVAITEVSIHTDIFLENGRLSLFAEVLSNMTEDSKSARLCILSPPMSGILPSMLSGSGAFCLPREMMLSEREMYTIRFSTTLTSSNSPVQVDVSIYEREGKDLLVLVDGRKPLGNPQPLAETLSAMVDLKLELVSDETLFRNVLFEKDLARVRLRKRLTRPWRKLKGEPFRV